MRLPDSTADASGARPRLAGIVNADWSGRLLSMARSIPWPLAVLVVVGIALRYWLSRSVDPVIVNPDAVQYLSMAAFDMFSDPARPAGYSILLEPLHFLSRNVDLTIWAQHMAGLATGVLLYATVRRVGAPIWVATVAAAPALLTFDQINYEHSLIPETSFTLLLAGALYMGVRALDDPGSPYEFLTKRELWIVGAALLIGLSVWLRGVGAPVIVVFALWLILAIPGRALIRVARGALAAGVAGAVVLFYFQLNDNTTGHFGLIQASGWTIYARAAPFADCDEFDPPAGTERLCEQGPPELRPGPDGYTWHSDSPARKIFGELPAGNDKLGAFGRAAIVNQPLDYLDAVGGEMIRYFGFNFEESIHYLSAQIEWLPGDRNRVMRFLNWYYDTEEHSLNQGRVDAIEDVQSVVRVHPPLLLASLLLALVGILLAPPLVRAALFLLVAVSLTLILVPPATATYNYRYSVPIAGPMLGAGAIGLWLIVVRLAAWRKSGQIRPT